jgi:hypothetical protein
MQPSKDLLLDPAIRDWVLIPIMAVMVLIGVLRHFVTLLLQSTPKTTLKSLRETWGNSFNFNDIALARILYKYYCGLNYTHI